MSATGIIDREEWFIKGAKWADENPAYISSEKQGEQKLANSCETCKDEQKPFDYENANIHQKDFAPKADMPRYSIGDVLCDKSCTMLNKESQPNFEITDIRNGMYICDKCSFPISQQDEYELVAKRIEQKTTDKAEPKFKVSDWIIYDRHISKVKDMDSEGYLVEDNYGDEGVLSKEFVEKHYHLWTIQDAKDGDVLAAYECYVIFKEIDGLNIKCYCTYHYMNNPSFYVDTLQNKNSFHPATKEQCDLLFKKMKEAGYEWDAEKKELKKISQRMVSAEAKEAMYDKPTDNDMVEALRTEYEKGMADTIAEMEKPTWSVEDMSKVQRICKYLDEAKKYYADITEVRECINWLKSLKDRVIPQPRQEWSKEDERILDALITSLNNEVFAGRLEMLKGIGVSSVINWLKSIKHS